MSKYIIYIFIATAIGIAFVLLIKGTPVKSTKTVEVPLPPPQYTTQFAYNETRERTVAIYFKTPIVNPSHFHFETVNTADHETDFGDGDTLVAKNGMTMERSLKLDAPQGNYRIRYKNCTSVDDCETGFFYTNIVMPPQDVKFDK